MGNLPASLELAVVLEIPLAGDLSASLALPVGEGDASNLARSLAFTSLVMVPTLEDSLVGDLSRFADLALLGDLSVSLV